MGLFDMFTDTVECPTCGEEIEAVFQTKTLGKGMNGYEVGDKVEQRDMKIEEGRLTDLTTSHQCEGPDRSKIENLLMDSMGAGLDELEDNIEEIKKEIHKSIRLKGDAVIEDGKFKRIENVKVK